MTLSATLGRVGLAAPSDSGSLHDDPAVLTVRRPSV